jgi:hypothetical protein
MYAPPRKLRSPLRVYCEGTIEGVAVESEEARAAIAAQEAAEAGDAVSPEPDEAERPRRRARRAVGEAAPARGSKGEAVFARVNELVAQEGINRSEAFARIGAETNARPGTVAANYYRVARKRGGEGIRPRARRGSAAAGPSRRGRRARGGDTARVIQGAEQALAALIDQVRRNEREIADLERENVRFQEIRRILK